MNWELRRLREEVLAGEVGTVRKEWGGKLRVALVYPNRYGTGMSNLGFLSVHARINARPDALCERAFLPGAGERAILSRRRVPLSTLESGRPLSEFDIVAFSLSYENDLLNAAGILSDGGVAPFRIERAEGGPGRPLVLAGGFAASLNAEPAGTLADAVVVGDGERAVEAILDLGSPRPEDEGYLKALGSIPGVYVPSGYAPEYGEPEQGDPPGFGPLLCLRPLEGFPRRVAREAVPPEAVPPVAAVLSEEAELGRMSLVETSRGCPRMCGFCAAAHACPAFREFSLETARAAADAAWPHRTTVGLIGAAVLDWRHFREFSREILARGGKVSPASIRADLVDDEIADILRRSGHRTVALAPECGREELRARVGKRVRDGVFFEAAKTLARAGIVSFKLYFLVGIPGSDAGEEVEGTVAFLREFRRVALEACREVGRMGTITAVLSSFVPKPFTPLQWAPMLTESELASRQDGIAAGVRGTANLRVSPDAPRSAVVQAYVGLSDRRVDEALRDAGKGRLKSARGPFAARIAQVVFREKGAGECFPWDVIDGGLPKRTLRARYEAMGRR